MNDNDWNDKAARVNGFDSFQDMLTQCGRVDVSTSARLRAFKKWQLEDGTKGGLMVLTDTMATLSDPKRGAENVYEFLVEQARIQGFSNVLHHVKRFVREGSKTVDGTREARRDAPRSWVEKGYVKQHGRCADCSQVMKLYGDSNDPLYATWDHAEPHSRGGALSKRNGRVICRGCNSSKGDRDPVEYSKRSGHLMTNLIGEDS